MNEISKGKADFLKFRSNRKQYLQNESSQEEPPYLRYEHNVKRNTIVK